MFLFFFLLFFGGFDVGRESLFDRYGINVSVSFSETFGMRRSVYALKIMQEQGS